MRAAAALFAVSLAACSTSTAHPPVLSNESDAAGTDCPGPCEAGATCTGPGTEQCPEYTCWPDGLWRCGSPYTGPGDAGAPMDARSGSDAGGDATGE